MNPGPAQVRHEEPKRENGAVPRVLPPDVRAVIVRALIAAVVSEIRGQA